MPVQPIHRGTLHYDVHGPEDAPWVILLPGAHNAPWQYWPLRDALAADFRVVQFDYRGLGRSTNDLWHVSPQQLASDTVALADALGIARAHVVPVSLGVVVLAEILHLRPSLVDRAAIAGMMALRGRMRALVPDLPPPPGPGGAELRPMQAVMHGMLGVFASPWFRETQPERFAFMKERMLALPNADILEGLRQFYGVFGHDSNRTRAVEALPRESRLFLTGEDDPLSPLDQARDHPALRAGPTVVFRGTGHLFFYERVAEFNAVVHRFLATGALPDPLPGGDRVVLMDRLPEAAP